MKFSNPALLVALFVVTPTIIGAQEDIPCESESVAAETCTEANNCQECFAAENGAEVDGEFSCKGFETQLSETMCKNVACCQKCANELAASSNCAADLLLSLVNFDKEFFDEGYCKFPKKDVSSCPDVGSGEGGSGSSAPAFGMTVGIFAAGGAVLLLN